MGRPFPSSIRPLLRAGALITLVAAPLAAAPATAFAAATAAPPEVDAAALAASPAGAVVASGRVTDASGRGTPATIAVLAWPTEEAQRSIHDGDRVLVPTVGHATTARDGTFSVRLSAASIPAGYTSRTGQVNLELFAWDASRTGSWHVSVTTDGGGGWRALGASLDSAPLRLATLRTDSGTLAVTPDVIGGGCAWILQTSYYNWVNVGGGYPYGSHSSWMTVGSSHSQTLGAAVSASGTFGSWSASGSSTLTDGVSFTWASSSAYRLYDVQVVYGAYQYRCTNGYIGGWQYNPRYPSGGYQTEGTGYPSWTGTCVPVSAGTWSRSITQGSNFSISGGVKAYGVIGIDLSDTSAYASDHALFYQLTASGHICGSDNVPSYANQIKTAA